MKAKLRARPPDLSMVGLVSHATSPWTTNKPVQLRLTICNRVGLAVLAFAPVDSEDRNGKTEGTMSGLNILHDRELDVGCEGPPKDRCGGRGAE